MRQLIATKRGSRFDPRFRGRVAGASALGSSELALDSPLLSRRFISFEGPEGSGKSTQARRLAERLRELGEPVLLTREPGGTKIGEQIREILLATNGEPLAAPTEALLMTAARAQHVSEVIVPALQRDDWVITDRYVDSTYAYQGAARGLPRELLQSTQRLATGGLLPEATFLLDLPVEVGLKRRFRAQDATNRLDGESLAFHEHVRTGYHSLVREAPERWIVIDASQAEASISAEIWDAILRRFGNTLPAASNLVSGNNE
jgi:dTMP kinase